MATGARAPRRGQHKRVRRGNAEDAQAMREELLQAAVDVFTEGGASALTLRAVAQKVGVSAMTPYRYFPDKAALLVGVWRQVLEELAACVVAAIARVDGGRDKQRAAIDAFLRYYEERPEHYRLLFGFEPSRALQDPQLADDASPVYARAVEVQTAVTAAFAREIGATMEHARLAADVRLAMSLGYLHATLVVRRYPWTEAALLRPAYVEQVVQAVERCLLGDGGAVTPAPATPPARPAAAAGGRARRA